MYNRERNTSLAAKLKQRWWLMLIFAMCNIAMAILLYNDRPVPVDENPPVPIARKEVYSIGILQSDDLPEQDKMLEGVMASLEAGGYQDGKNMKVELVKAAGSERKVKSAVNQFVRSKKDLIIAIGTPSAKAAAKVTKSIPVVGVGILYFQKDKDFEDHENFTGISDYPQVVNQVRMA